MGSWDIVAGISLNPKAASTLLYGRGFGKPLVYELKKKKKGIRLYIHIVQILQYFEITWHKTTAHPDAF